MGHFTSLEAWKAAHTLAVEVTRATMSFPSHERFELASQLRRAALSVPTNIVEGRARFGRREYLRFVRIALASVAEVEYLLYFAREMQYLSQEEHHRLDGPRRRANILIAGLARGLDPSP
ncbi:MAG TPA: four helix bundle protein [Gemmatimonadales bacterium]|nr:four helix bundle protein [Gemmatimonadales bacterium]